MGYPTNKTGRPGPNIAAQGERLQGLLGERGKDGGLKALTRGDAAAFGAVALKAQLVTAAPTADQHNALVEDIRAIAALLNGLGAKFTGF